jgi:hypothetical protein
MSSKTLFRLSGLALLIALPFMIVGFILHPPSEEVSDVLKVTYGPAHLIEFIAWIFALLGLPGLYARQAHRAGILGLVGFVLTMIAAAYHIYLLLYEAFATPLLAQNPATQALIGPGGPLAHGAEGAMGAFAFVAYTLVLAWPLFGIATVRAHVLPRAVGWLQIASVPAFVLGMVLMSILLASDVLTRMPLGASPLAMMYYLLFLAYAWGGYMLWTEKERGQETVAQTEAPQLAI